MEKGSRQSASARQAAVPALYLALVVFSFADSTWPRTTQPCLRTRLPGAGLARPLGRWWLLPRVHGGAQALVFGQVAEEVEARVLVHLGDVLRVPEVAGDLGLPEQRDGLTGVLLGAVLALGHRHGRVPGGGRCP